MGIKMNVYFVNRAQQLRLVKKVKEMGFVRPLYGEPTPNISGLLQAIADGAAIVVRKEDHGKTPAQEGSPS